MNRFNQTGRGRLVQPSPVTIEPTKANHDFLHLLETTHTHTHTLTHTPVDTLMCFWPVTLIWD